MLMYIIALISGGLAGVVGALLGVSGGIIMLPVNQFILGFSPAIAVGTSLFAAIFTTTSGAYGHFRNGNVQVKSALLIGGGGLVGVLLGSYVFKAYLSNNTAILQMLLGLLFLFMAVRMGRGTYREWHQGKTHPPQQAPYKYQSLLLILLGLLTGTMAGVFGVGGGFILVPVLIWYFAAKPYEAVGTTLLAMLPYVAAGAMIKTGQNFVNLPCGLLLGLGAIAGAQLGVVISRNINPLIFKLTFTLLFLYLAGQYLSPLLSVAA
jgi:uncharacterized membrane protein YfcA